MMTKDSALDKAEKNLQEQEAAGISYGTPEARSHAKVSMAEVFEKEQRQGTSVTTATAGAEGGNVVGAGVGDPGSLEEIDAQLARLRQGHQTAESMAARKKLNEQKSRIMDGMDIPISFDRN